MYKKRKELQQREKNFEEERFHEAANRMVNGISGHVISKVDVGSDNEYKGEE